MVNPIDRSSSISGSPSASTGDTSQRSLASGAETARRSMRERMQAFNAFRDRSLATGRTYLREHPVRSAVMAVAAGALLRRVMSRSRLHH